jgi:rubrerythrin
MCEDCKKLVNASRKIKAHSNLIETGSKEIKSPMGSADETYYTCQVCGHKWTRETGNCGTGWF